MSPKRSYRPKNVAGRLVVLYTRVSSKDQEKEGFSIPAQLKLLREYAAAQALAVDREFQDVETAKRAGRPGFTDMVAHLKRTPGRHVILVEKTDRLYRNFRDYVTIDELDVDIHFVKENTVVSPGSRSGEKLIHGIKVLMAKNYIDNLSEETRKGQTEKAAQGIWPSFAPLGYQNVVGPNGKRIIEPDPHTAPIVTGMFERYATGRHSLKDVTSWAVHEGLVFRKSRAAVPRATVHKMLRNRIYTGDFDWDGKHYRGTHTPLVSLDLWTRVQTVLDGRSHKSGRLVKHDFAFARLLTCGHCGCALVGEMKKGRYVYYHCTGNNGPCPKPYAREQQIAAAFGAVLDSIRIDADVLEWLTEALRQSFSDEVEYHKSAIARLRETHDRLQVRLDTMYVDKLDGKISEAFYEAKSREWRSEQNRIEQQLGGHKVADRTYLDNGVQLLELAAKARILYEMQSAHEKRRLLDFVCSNSRWGRDGLQVELRQPFDLISVTAAAHQKEKAAGVASNGLSENWLLGQDSNLQPSG